MGGSISKDLKSKELLVPSFGVLKISGHKFLCMNPLKEVQLVKNESNFALIINYAVVVALGRILENWKFFKKFFHPSEKSGADFPQELRAMLDTHVREVLLHALGHVPTVVSRSKKLGETRNSS